MRERRVKAFPWQALPVVDARTARVAAAVTGWVAARPGLARVEIPTPAGPIVVRAGRAEVLEEAALAAALADPTSAVAVVRAAGRAAHVVAGGALVRAIARVVLGGPDELAAARAPTPAERGVLVYAVAAALAASGARADAEPSDLAGPLLAVASGAAIVVELDVDGAARGWAALVLPLDLLIAAPPRRPLAALAAAAGAWLDAPAIAAAVVLGAARLPRARAAAIAPRDVVVLDRPAGGAALAVARGRVPLTLAPGGGVATVSGAYARGTMDETLGDDASVEVDACAGTIAMTVRQVLELAPGQVLSLGEQIGGQVELRVGRRVVGRGELVDVDGDLGVRVTSVAAVAAAPGAAAGAERPA